MPAVPRTAKIVSTGCVALWLAECGSGAVSGELSSRASGRSVTLLNNGAYALMLDGNGSFTFADSLRAGEAYAVTVQTQPAGQSCTVDRGSGTSDSDGNSVDDVRVSCSFTASLRGTVSGSSAGMALTLIDGSIRQVVTSNGDFAFPGTLDDGARYDVRVDTQPFGATCSVTNGAGPFFAATFRDVEVGCV
jgi:hypothetical protein